MEQLIQALENLYADKENIYQEDDWTGFNDTDDYNNVVCLCDDYLIKSGGCNWDNIKILRDNGYRVYPGEKDSFGWLTGCVQKIGDQRVVVFG